MTRRTVALVVAIAVLLAGTLYSALPARASHSHTTDPSQINPTLLALPLSSLPPYNTVCMQATLNSSGAITAATFTASNVSGQICGSVLDFLLPAPASGSTPASPGQIIIGGQKYVIAVGATLTNADIVDSLDHAGVSDNNDANGTTTPPDGFKSQLRILHQTPYDQLGRITGYRMDFHYSVSGSPAGTEYLASIFPTAAKAQAAMQDAIGPGSLISIIGAPLTHQCHVGDMCAAFSGPNPGTSNKAVVAIFTDGPVMVETATQVPAATFDALEPSLETTLYGFLAAADVQVKIALNTPPGPPSNATNTATPVPPTPTNTVAPTNTATATATTPPPPPSPTTKKKCPKNSTKKHGKCVCKKGYVKKHGKCVKKK